MAEARPVSTPMEANTHLPKLAVAEVDAREYQCALGGLMYAMLGTRPDIAHAVGVLSQHAATPGKVHWTALMRVYRYLCRTSDMALTFGGNRKNEPLTGFADADYAGDHVDRCSITSFVFLLHRGAISWGSKKQHTVALSSTEAEYVAGSQATREAIWLRLLLSEIRQLAAGPTSILIDNQSAIALAKNPVFHGSTKHISVQHHFIREKLEEGVDPVGRTSNAEVYSCTELNVFRDLVQEACAQNAYIAARVTSVEAPCYFIRGAEFLGPLIPKRG